MPAQNKSVIIATQNKGKVKEFVYWFEPLGVEVSSLADYDEFPEILENGATFAENALIKARTIANYLHVPVLADDSGLMVDALDGRPGIYSARFAGLQATDEENNSKLISELAELNPLADIAEAELAQAPFTVEETPQEPPQILSRARFVCALAYIDPVQNRILEAEGVCEGYIIREPRGHQGFGYDPYFYLPHFDKTMAELPIETKNQISHRALALQQFIPLFAKDPE